MIILKIFGIIILISFIREAYIDLKNGYNAVKRREAEERRQRNYALRKAEKEKYNINNEIAHLEQQKRDYLELYKIIETDQNINKRVQKTKLLTLDNKIYLIDQKLFKLYEKSDG